MDSEMHNLGFGLIMLFELYPTFKDFFQREAPAPKIQIKGLEFEHHKRFFTTMLWPIAISSLSVHGEHEPLSRKNLAWNLICLVKSHILHAQDALWLPQLLAQGEEGWEYCYGPLPIAAAHHQTQHCLNTSIHPSKMPYLSSIEEEATCAEKCKKARSMTQKKLRIVSTISSSRSRVCILIQNNKLLRICSTAAGGWRIGV